MSITITLFDSSIWCGRDLWRDGPRPLGGRTALRIGGAGAIAPRPFRHERRLWYLRGHQRFPSPRDCRERMPRESRRSLTTLACRPFVTLALALLRRESPRRRRPEALSRWGLRPLKVPAMPCWIRVSRAGSDCRPARSRGFTPLGIVWYFALFVRGGSGHVRSFEVARH